MVAAGSALAVPTGLHLVELARDGAMHPAATADVATAWQPPSEPWPPTAAMPLGQGPTVPSERLEYVPPPPAPEPLPPGPSAHVPSSPELAPGYRPTLQSPPPPLLDAESAPPLAVGWTTRHSESRTVVGAAPGDAVEQPRIYVVRDGDDLTGIASRFYGHPAAATAIWQANRGLLRDPGLLPIGAALVLPPQSAVAALSRPADRAIIEPAAHGQSDAPTSRQAISRPASWLSEAGVPNGGVQPSPSRMP
jgi:phage tail protein X